MPDILRKTSAPVLSARVFARTPALILKRVVMAATRPQIVRSGSTQKTGEMRGSHWKSAMRQDSLDGKCFGSASYRYLVSHGTLVSFSGRDCRAAGFELKVRASGHAGCVCPS